MSNLQLQQWIDGALTATQRWLHVVDSSFGNSADCNSIHHHEANGVAPCVTPHAKLWAGPLSRALVGLEKLRLQNIAGNL